MKPRGTEDFVKNLPPDEPLTLVRAPDNPVDPNAVEVWARGRHIGFVRAYQAATLSAFILRSGEPWVEPGAKIAMDRATPMIRKSVTAKFLPSPNSKVPMAEVEILSASG